VIEIWRKIIRKIRLGLMLLLSVYACARDKYHEYNFQSLIFYEIYQLVASRQMMPFASFGACANYVSNRQLNLQIYHFQLNG
jgi:hypothetical protein